MAKGHVNLTFILISIICFVPVHGKAYVLGGIKVKSSINEPLNAEIPISDISAQELRSLKVQLTTELNQIRDKKNKKKNHIVLPSLSADQLRAVVRERNGRAFLHVTSKTPLYSECDKQLYNCYDFYRFGILARWGLQYKNYVKRSYPIIPHLDSALGDINLRSNVGEPLLADIRILSSIEQIKSIRVRLAPKEAWLKGIHFGESEYQVAKNLGLHFDLDTHGEDPIVRVTSEHSVKRTFSNPVQTTHMPLVLLLEAIWEGGRELKKITIYMPS